MKKKLLPLSIILSVTAGHVSADNFYPFHARASAMGNTGVASSRSSEAAFYNPGLLSQQEHDAGTEILLPFGVIAADEDELIDSFDDIDDGGYVDNFTNAIDAYNVIIERYENGENPDAEAISAAEDVNLTISELNEQIEGLDENKVRINTGVGLVVAIPSKDFAIAFAASSHASISARFDYQDSETVAAYGDGIEALTIDLINDTVDPNNPAYAGLVDIDENTGEISLSEPTLESEVEAVGIVFNELAIPMAREVEIGGQKFGLGITPKYVSVTTYDYLAKVIDEGEDGINDVSDKLEDYEEKDSNFNLDIGISYKTGNWSTGLAIRNLISQEYDTITDRQYELKPHARIGGAYSDNWYTVAVDLDLTEQDGLFEDQETQFVAVGAEFDVADIVQLRAGFNHNLSDTDLSMWSAGIGLSPWGVLMELSVTSAPEIDAAGLNFQMGYRF